MEKKPEEVSTGATRAASLLREKADLNRTFYENLPSVNMSRQYKRRIQQITQKRVDAMQKKEAIKARRRAPAKI